MLGKQDVNFYLISRLRVKGYAEKVSFSYCGTKLDRKRRRAGQALGLKAACNLECGDTNVFGGKSGLRARSPEF